VATIVCAIDDSPGSLEALRVASELSESLGVRLVLAHVARRNQHSTDRALSDSQARDRAESLLTRVCRERGLDGRVDRRAEVGNCATELARIASEEAAAVLVVGSRGSRTLRRGLVGDLAAELSCASACPVVVVPAPPPASRVSSRSNR
jgi:nucleotide-binding universal stress UspA family protein